MAKIDGEPCKKCGCTLYHVFNSKNTLSGKVKKCVDCHNAAGERHKQKKKINRTDYKKESCKITAGMHDIDAKNYKKGFYSGGDKSGFSFMVSIRDKCAWLGGFNDAGHGD
tara:strand:+ start:119 stop:451 length:333 start_codon:yes stop_codon:yes gene_type:complete